MVGISIKESENYIIYFTYPYKKLRPDVIIKIVTPDEAQAIVQQYSAITGERVKASLSGIGAACGECTALPIVTNKPNVSVGCYGSRPGINLKKRELIIAAPFSSKMYSIITK